MDKPYFTIAFGRPDANQLVPGFFDSDDNSVMRLLEKPNSLRFAGWDLSTMNRAEIIEGKYLEIRNGDRKTIQVYPDGAMLGRFSLSNDFLSWASENNDLRINSLAISELLINFTGLYKKIIEKYSEIPNRIICVAVITNANLLKMSPYGLKSMGWTCGLEDRVAPSGRMDKTFDIPIAAFDSSERVAYLIVEKVLNWFGFPSDMVPYRSTDQNGNLVLDIGEGIK